MPLWCTNCSSFYLNTSLPTSQHLLYHYKLAIRSLQMSSSTSSSYPEGYDNLNQSQIGPFGPTNGQTPFVPQPLGSYTAPISHLPYPPGLLPSPGQLQLGSPSPNGNYLISSNSLPIMGREYFPQVGNLSLSSQDSWSSGFTEALPDNSRMDRKSSPSLQSALEVSQVDTSND